MERTSITKFVDTYKKATNETTKQSMVKKHVVSHYAPFLSKLNILQMMCEKSVKEGKSGSYIDMSTSKLNFIVAIIVLYTDLEVDKEVDPEGKEISKSWEAYDLLKESGALDAILNEIGSDLEELISVQDQVLTTWHNEHSSIQAYVSSLVEKVSMIFSTAVGQKMQPIVDMFNGLSDEEKQNLFSLLKSE